MFNEETLSFLRDLARNNERSWFVANKARYDLSVKDPSVAVAEMIASDLAEAYGQPFRSKIFRIHRDLRFSKDPTPYNTHVHMSFVPDGAQDAVAAWLLGLSPTYFTLGCGAMVFARPALGKFRESVAGPAGEHFAAVLSELRIDGIRLSEPELKRVPAPWPKDHPSAGLLRHKGLVGWIDAEPEDGLGPGMREATRAGFARLSPLFELLSGV
ncbi:DUF2461 domain-containing protein [Tropicimonas marinistellae]|uniref:DUF2461 domain-containing protein n=1 Tax=Tropicimonas marinistellae TaxID=1739787 RepID=UPI00082F45E8|nr:TIGR02453 family protein [Tropicimonas marinistellae]